MTRISASRLEMCSRSLSQLDFEDCLVTNVLKINSMHAFLLLCLEVELILYIQDGARKEKISKTTDT